VGSREGKENTGKTLKKSKPKQESGAIATKKKRKTPRATSGVSGTKGGQERGIETWGEREKTCKKRTCRTT